MHRSRRHLLSRPTPPAILRSWLLDSGSLTHRLQQHSGNQFSVTVLKQRWEKPRWDEARALGIPAHQYALIREVILYGRGEPWVYARSVLPQKTLNGELRFLRRLGSRPLGALLFSNPSIKRGAVVLQRYPTSLLPESLRQTHTPSLWGRYSIFWQSAIHRSKYGILVSEVFLPALLDSVMLAT